MERVVVVGTHIYIAHRNRKQVEIPSLNLCELYNLNKKKKAHHACHVQRKERRPYDKARGNRRNLRHRWHKCRCCQRQSYCAIMAEIKTTTMRDYNLYGNKWPRYFVLLRLARKLFDTQIHPLGLSLYSIYSFFFMVIEKKTYLYIFVASFCCAMVLNLLRFRY